MSAIPIINSQYSNKVREIQMFGVKEHALGDSCTIAVRHACQSPQCLSLAFLCKWASAVWFSEFNCSQFSPPQATSHFMAMKSSRANISKKSERGREDAVFKMELHTFSLPIFHTMKSLENCLGKLMLPPGKFQVPKQLFLTSPPEVLLLLAAFHRSYFLPR